MATPFLDNFTEASDTNLESHTPSGGTAWTLTGTAAAAIINAATDTLRSRTTSASIYTCDDQGSADQYTQARLKTLSASFPNSYVACRLVDASNFVGWRCAGTGSTGLRLCEVVGGTVTDKYTFQGVDESVYRVEVSGTTAKIFEDGVQKGTDQTIGSSTETSQGVRIGSDNTNSWIDDFEAGALGGGGTTIDLTIASLGFTTYAPQNTLRGSLTAAMFTTTPQAIQNRQTITQTSPSLTFTANTIQSRLSAALSAASLSFTAHAISVIEGAGAFVIDLSAATFAYSAKAIQLAQSMAMSAASLVMTAGTVALTQAVSLTAATMSFVGQAMQNRLTIGLTAAVLTFTAWALDVTGAIASAAARMLMLLGVGS